MLGVSLNAGFLAVKHFVHPPRVCSLEPGGLIGVKPVVRGIGVVYQPLEGPLLR
jgi:hypothetical protein